MQLKFLTCALFASAAIAATNNAAAIKADINTLSGYLDQLTGDSKQFNNSFDSISFALQVQIDAVNIDKTLTKAIQDCQSSTTLNDNDSLAIGAQLLALSNNVKSSLNTIKSKAAGFADLKPIVLNSLYGLRLGTNSFGTALTAKLAPVEKAVAPAVTADLNNAFNSAITTYGGTPW